MPDTFFTRPPHWEWLVILYFFVGGLAGGSYFLAALVDLFGRPADRPIARLGYYIAFPAVVLGGLLLTVDLGRPLRFWHMLIQSKTGFPAFKWWSPMSVGSWALLLFGLFAFLAFVGSLAEAGFLPRGLAVLRAGPLGVIVQVVGGLLGFFVASYTGVLLSVTNRPLWADTTLLGLLFLISATSTSAALMLLLGQRLPCEDCLEWLGQMDRWALVAELVALGVVAASLGGVLGDVWGNLWGVLLVVGVVLIGILVPLALHFWPRALGRLSVPTAATLVLVGGFILRMVVVLSSERV